MKKAIRAWVNLGAVRSIAKSGPEAVTQLDALRKVAAKSDRHADTAYWSLRQVYYEVARAGQHDVAAALALLAADICRPRGENYELMLAEVLCLAADSHHRGGEPALETIEESITLFERHLAKSGAPYAVALGLLAEIQHAAGQHEAAIDAAERALDLERRWGSANVPAAKLRLARVSGAGH